MSFVKLCPPEKEEEIEQPLGLDVVERQLSAVANCNRQEYEDFEKEWNEVVESILKETETPENNTPHANYNNQQEYEDFEKEWNEVVERIPKETETPEHNMPQTGKRKKPQTREGPTKRKRKQTMVQDRTVTLGDLFVWFVPSLVRVGMIHRLQRIVDLFNRADREEVLGLPKHAKKIFDTYHDHPESKKVWTTILSTWKELMRQCSNQLTYMLDLAVQKEAAWSSIAVDIESAKNFAELCRFLLTEDSFSVFLQHHEMENVSCVDILQNSCNVANDLFIQIFTL